MRNKLQKICYKWHDLIKRKMPVKKRPKFGGFTLIAPNSRLFLPEKLGPNQVFHFSIEAGLIFEVQTNHS